MLAAGCDLSVPFKQKLQEKLNEMECELRSIRQAAQFQERTIQGLTDSIDTKDGEVCFGSDLEVT